jgi:hypothetical protein
MGEKRVTKTAGKREGPKEKSKSLEKRKETKGGKRKEEKQKGKKQ